MNKEPRRDQYSYQDMREIVFNDLKRLRDAYYHNNHREFAEIVTHITGYFFLDLISSGAYCRVMSMKFERGLK